jgi:two-component sensor histidine kinase/CheY-like chemotaxis protein
MKVVMVDDSSADRNLCRILLEEVHGPTLQFFEEQRAAAGLHTCRRIQPDCLLLDYKLPEMTGLQFLQHLREDAPGDPEFAVVMLTGWASEQVAVDAMKAGAQDYLVKDRITADGLSLAVQKAMQKVSLLRVLREERDRLARSLAEKEVLLKEVHHRVKNNLQVVASLLRLQAASMGSPELAAALEESQHRLESMAMIHEQLYESGDLREVDLAKHATQLMGNLFASYGVDPVRIRGRVAIPLTPNEPLLLDVHRAIPAGLILNELVSNALKHAFPAGRCGSISVEGEQRAGNVTLVVGDDGVGLPADFDSRAPTSGKKGSLGLHIVEILARQLRGVLTVERGRGATFRLTFPERPV